VLLVRHAATDDGDLSEPFPLVDGRGDPPLSALGRAQARHLADRLGDAGPGALYVSGLRRTLETARPLATRTGLRPVVEPALAELHLGEWEAGRYRYHLAADDHRALLAFVHGRWEPLPGAEPLAFVATRGRSALDGMARRHPGELVVAFTHRILIDVLLGRIAAPAARSYAGADHTSVTTLVGTATAWHLVAFNDTSHLGPAVLVPLDPAATSAPTDFPDEERP
jgi:probable phosphoglycerate mutase